MANDDPEPPKAVVQAPQAPKESSPRIYTEINADMNQPQPSNPPETPTPPPGATNSIRVLEPVTLPESHQTALRHIHTLETHNAKLYEDNCRLVNAVNMLNDRLAFFGAPQNTQVLRLADMQERLRTSEANWASINRKYQDLLQCTPSGSPQHHISVELQAIRNAYASLDKEYRLLADKYVRLKAVADTSRIAQQQSQGTGRLTSCSFPHRCTRCQFANATQLRVHDQSRNNSASPTSVMSSGSFQPFMDQRGGHRRRSSESVMAQASLRPGTTPIATTWSAPLPTPPPSAPLLGGQISPTGFPVYTPVPAGSLPLPHHAQMIHESRTLSGSSAVPPSRHLVEQGASEQLKAAIHCSQRCGEITDTANNEPIPCSKQIPAPVALKSSPRPPKRLNSELQTSTSPEGERKKPRIEGEAVRPTTTNADTYLANKILSPPASTDPRNDHKLSMSSSDVRSYQDCVDLIFEKDADVENGVFCGLCLDRYEAKMILEPPDVLVQPDFDFLASHCMTMHPTVWDDLRRKA
ncbi:hypothetical protein J3R83DRAFT_790 [Lanmaoa asiatica]|nr:hypothetical protein J3R83DRAFT_790 [Lanmaoa asiatica]